MKITIESTAEIVSFERRGNAIDVRVWRGSTEEGVEIVALIAAVSPQSHDPAAHAQCERDLQEVTEESRVRARSIDPRFVL